MKIFIKNKSDVPIYEQIQSQILRFIEAGVLNPGDKLPSVRQMAMDNGINPNTVAKAYAEMEKNGYVESYSQNADNGKKRTYYKITERGKNYYHEKCLEWYLTKEVVENFIRGDK